MEAKLKKKKYLNHLQHNICRNHRLYQQDFYEQFDKFLFNYGVVLLNPYRKNNLFCNQLSFLSYTVRFFCSEEGATKRSADEEGDRHSSDGGSTSRDGDLLSDDGGAEDVEDELHRMDIDAKRKEIWDTIKSKVEAEGEDAAKRRQEAEKKRLRENPLCPYEDLNEYINLLMVTDKEEINFPEELFFLISQLLVKHKNNLYISVLLSILKTLRQIKRKIDVLRYLQVLVFLCDVNLSKIRMFLFKSVVDAIVQVHRAPKRGSKGLKHSSTEPVGGPKVADEILLLLHEAFVENKQRKRIQKKYASTGSNDSNRRHYLSNVPITESLNNFACSVLIELIKKKIYVTKKNINFLCEGIFYKNEKIVKCVSFALLGKLDNRDFVIRMAKEKMNTNNEIDNLKNISNQTHQKLSKAKIKKLHQKKEKILSKLYKNNQRECTSSDEDIVERNKGKGGGEHLSNRANYTFIDLLFDPHSFANNIFNLICTKYRNSHGTVKLLLLNILCRLHQRNQIVQENLFLYYEKLLENLKSKTLLPKYLSTFIQCIHGTTPSMYVQRIVHVLTKKFLFDNMSAEFIYLIINAIVEILSKCPDCLDEEVFEAIIVFKDYKNKNTATLIRRFVNLCKEINPELLSRKFLDKKTALHMQRRKILSSASGGVVPDTSSILQYSYLLRAGRSAEEGDDDDDDDDEENDNDDEEEDDDGNEDDEDEGEVDSGVDEEEVESDVHEVGSGEEVDDDNNDDEDEDDDDHDDDEDDHVMDDVVDDDPDDMPNDQPSRPHGGRQDKQTKKARRRDEKVKKEQRILQKNEQILSQKILTDQDFRKLKRMRDYVANNKKILMSDLQDICNAEYSEEQSDSSGDEGQEKIITHEDLLMKKKIKKQELMKVKIKKKSQSDNRFKTNKEKEKKKSVMMLAQKLRRKKKNNAVVQYGKIKKKLKGKLAARAKKRGILQKRIAKKLSRRRR
ncbi:protein SDA1, putative [Plasmodium knowlesi strain H]|uniref:Protein SDA1, putative n=3 Tax=Plasmodium knowlesi TaxID=5850 RepID=A0A5K1VLW1_PLAKH|nr:protein SDA1, putative [Plasmodium knowlesi strain H]OTN68411.1 putative Protein SDA1 [Plasmodium knowlesi]CAA9986531.1 protein SDA1, putative [Plasmodium knowlesi strain H]SBO24204.1 protein SDA1, putative [Plasmodium knowlesi strain H]SBO29778.1 protein SDA1, putative [Plasmodium knowlesi strain H]VVS76005.1 protein SDA1, putative [Plasmodium knowlesi strain H]|eukprot:XP_002261082.1 hypothetical protein, conserved in Plasmodium species [Plasmodium knowlesi strain H]